MGGQPHERPEQRQRPRAPSSGRTCSRSIGAVDCWRFRRPWRVEWSRRWPASTTSTSRCATSRMRPSVPDDWQRHMATVIQQAVARLPKPVLVSQNIANYALKVADPHPAISIFNFHYATPPDAVAWNAHLRGVIGDNETGFRGTADERLSDGGVGLPRRRRRPLQQPRLLVHGRPRRRHVHLPVHAARRRRAVAAPATGDPARFHERLRVRAHEAGERRADGGRAGWRVGPRAG